MTRRAGHFIPLVTLTGLVACGGGATQTPELGIEPPPPSFQVRAEELQAVLPVEGTVSAQRRAEVSTRLMARVTAIPVDVGSSVRRGELLMRLGTQDVAAMRSSAEAAVAAARAARDEAVRHAARMDTLLAQDAVARVQRDQAHLALTHAESQLSMAHAALTEVATAESYATIRAPFDGAVVERRIDVGDLAAPGVPLMVFESDGPRDAVFAIPIDVASEVAVGDYLRVTTRDGRSTKARIRAISPGADVVTRTVEVKADLPAQWPTGTAVTGLYPAGTYRGVAIPVSAVVRRGQLTGVRVVTDHGIGLRWVRLGRMVPPVGNSEGVGEPHVEVLSGLETGERIVP